MACVRRADDGKRQVWFGMDSGGTGKERSAHNQFAARRISGEAWGSAMLGPRARARGIDIQKH